MRNPYNYGAMKTVVLAWTFFILMGLFASLVVPLGEGFDEPWHLGYVQDIAPALHLSIELEQFLRLHPIGWRLHEIYPELHTQEEYWQQPEAERLKTDDSIRALQFSKTTSAQGQAEFSKQYESHQAPLYYVVTGILFFWISMLFSLTNTFLLIRLWSVLLASAVVPLAYLLAKRVTSSEASAEAVAILVAMFPGIYPDIARVSNDALVVPVAAAIFLALARYLDSRSKYDGLLLALALLAGLLTKAFFIPVFAAIALALVLLKEFQTLKTLGWWSAAGWFWYARNIFITGSVTGLPETVAAKTSIASSLTSLGLINWIDMFRLTAVSHIWMGNWSLLQYRSWIYKTVMLIFIVGLIGFIACLRKSSSKTIQALLLIYAVYGASLIYYATQVFQQAGISVIQGWYLSPLIPIEAVVFVLGIELLFSRRGLVWITGIVALCFLAMLIYGTAFIEAPYYTGLTDHGPTGSLRAYHPHWADIGVMGERLTRFHGWIPSATPLVSGITVLFTGLFLIWSYASQHSFLSSRH